MNEFSLGVKSMARNTIPALNLVRKGEWTLDDVERWLNAVIGDDVNYLEETQQLLTTRQASKEGDK